MKKVNVFLAMVVVISMSTLVLADICEARGGYKRDYEHVQYPNGFSRTVERVRGGYGYGGYGYYGGNCGGNSLSNYINPVLGTGIGIAGAKAINYMVEDMFNPQPKVVYVETESCYEDMTDSRGYRRRVKVPCQ